jgi:hypothetical protein
MTAAEAAAREADISDFVGDGHEPGSWRRVDSDARGKVEILEEVGRFLRSEDGALFYFRCADQSVYSVSAQPGTRFARFVAKLFRLNSRHPDTEEIIEHVAEHVRDSDRAALIHVVVNAGTEREWRAPFRLAKKKKGAAHHTLSPGHGKRTSARKRRH